MGWFNHQLETFQPACLEQHHQVDPSKRTVSVGYTVRVTQGPMQGIFVFFFPESGFSREWFNETVGMFIFFGNDARGLQKFIGYNMIGWSWLFKSPILWLVYSMHA